MLKYNPQESRARIAQLQRAIQEENERLRRYSRIPPEVLLSQQRNYINHLEQQLLGSRMEVREFQARSLLDTQDPQDPLEWRNNRTEKLQNRMNEFAQRRARFEKKRNPQLPKEALVQQEQQEQKESNDYHPDPLEEYYHEEAERYRSSEGLEPSLSPHLAPQTPNEPKQFKKESCGDKRGAKDPRVDEFDSHIRRFGSDPERNPEANIMMYQNAPLLMLDDHVYPVSEIIDALAVYRGQDLTPRF